MGLCTSRTSVSLEAGTPGNPGTPGTEPAAPRALHPRPESPKDEGILMVQPIKTKSKEGGGGVNHTAKGYLEVGGKRRGEGEGPTARGEEKKEQEAGREEEEEEEEEERDGVEELIKFCVTEGSLKSECLE